MTDDEAMVRARRLAEPEGLRAFRLAQAASRESPAYEAVEEAEGPSPIGIWSPVEDRFERSTPWTHGDFWAPAPQLGPKGTRKRAVLLGESAAAGMFYRPAWSPAAALQSALGATWEVVDLAKISIGRFELVELAYDAMQLAPDVLVFFAGNNWTRRAGPWAELPLMQEWGDALEAGGVAGLAGLQRRRLLEDVEDALDDLQSLEVPVVLTAPEVNLEDWERRRPPPWLPGDGSPRWHALRAEGAPADALQALDGGLCAASQRGAAAVEAAAWDGWFPSVPQTTDAVRAALLEGGRKRDFAIVDLREVLGAAGRAEFLDYCHLTAPAIARWAGAVASRILRREVAPPDPALSEGVEDLARFTAALHRAHREAPLDGRPRRPDFPASMRPIFDDLREAKLSGLPPALTAAYRRVQASPRPLDPHAWAWGGIDAAVIEALGGPIGDLPRGPQELGDRHLEQPADAFLEGSAYDARLADRAYYREAWPVSRFCVHRAAGEATLELTARVPVVEGQRPGPVELLVDGRRIGALPSSPGWTRGRFRASIAGGLCRVELRWPPLAPDGDEALRRARERYLLGLWTDLFPVFGEVCRLRIT